MTNKSDPQQFVEGQPDLIGLHMDLLDAEAAAELRASIAASPELQRQAQVLDALLRPLDALQVGKPSAELTSRILARVAAAPRLAAASDDQDDASSQTIPFSTRSRSRRALLRGENAPAVGGSGISMRELVGLAAAVALFVGIFIPGYQQSRMNAQRVACADNLRNVGVGLGGYAASFGDAMPYASAASGSFLGTGGSARPAAPNSRHTFLLLQLGMIDPAKLICPGRPGDRPMGADQIRSAKGFADICNISYSTLMVPDALQTGKVGALTPLMSDQNPLFDDGKFHPRREFNSDSHGLKAGQNVLRADGSSTWSTTTTLGPDGDDMMTLADVSTYTGMERPMSTTDIFLVP